MSKLTLTIHIADIDVGYIRRRFVGTDKAGMEAEIAATCRVDWEGNDWDEDRFPDGPPKMPDTDKAVLKRYFWRKPGTADGPWIEWSKHKIEMLTKP